MKPATDRFKKWANRRIDKLRGIEKLLTEEFKRSYLGIAIAFFLSASLFYVFGMKYRVFFVVSDAINHMIRFRLDAPADTSSPGIYVIRNIREPTAGEVDSAIQLLYEASLKTDKKVTLVTELGWVFQETLSDTPNNASIFATINRDTLSHMKVLFVYPSAGKYKGYLKGYDSLPKGIKENICYLNYLPLKRDRVATPYSFSVPISKRFSLIMRISEFFGLPLLADTMEKETVKVITKLTPPPYKVISLGDPIMMGYRRALEPALKILHNPRSPKNVIFIYLPSTFDKHVIFVPGQHLQLSDVYALSIWETLHPVEAKPLPMWVDFLIFGTVMVLIWTLRKRVNNLFFTLGMLAFTVLGATWYVLRPFHITFYDRYIFELGISLWVGYFTVFIVESSLFGTIMALIKRFVMESQSYKYLQHGLAHLFYSSLQLMIPEIAAIVVETREFFITRRYVIGEIDVNRKAVRKNYVPYTIRRRIGIFKIAVLKVYLPIDTRPTKEELNFIKRAWNDPVFMPLIFDKIYTEKALRGKAFNIYSIDAYTKALVHESIGFRKLIDSMDSGAAIFCSTGILLYCNSKLQKILGKGESAPQSTVFDLLSKTFMEPLIPLIREKMLLGGEATRDVFDAKNDRHYRVSFRRLSTERSKNLYLYMMIVQDVTYFFKLYIEESIIRKNTIRMISHELGNALSSYELHMKVIKDKTKGIQDDMLHSRLDKLELAIKMVVEHVEKLSFFARLKQDSLPLKLTNVKLKDLVMDIVRFIESVYKSRKLWANSEIIVDVPDNISLVADRVLLKIVLKNLIENALKYSRSRALVVAREEGENVIIEIEDDGKGIPPEKIDLIWKPFERAQEKKETGEAIPGLGLGLFIVQYLFKIKAIDGEISVGRSEKLGGAKFTLVIRKKPNHPNTTSR